jgi:hypothetical protein
VPAALSPGRFCAAFLILTLIIVTALPALVAFGMSVWMHAG